MTSAKRFRSGAMMLAVTVPLLIVVLSGRGTAQQRVAMSGGGAWLASPAQGVVTLIDGPSDQVVGTVRMPRGGPATTSVVQTGTSAYLVDAAAGTVARVDGSTYQVSQPFRFGTAGGALTVLPGAGTTYVVDGSRRVASVTDPGTLAVRRTLSLVARPGDGQSVVDSAGRLWVLDGETGELAWFDHAGEHLRGGVGAAGDQLLLVRGHPALVDRRRDRVGGIGPDGTVGGWSCLGIRPSDRTQLLGSVTSDQEYAAVRETGTLLVVTLGGDGDNCTEEVPVATPGSEFGPLVEVGGFVLVPDRSTGRTVIVDVAHRREVAHFAVSTAGHALELLAKDGLVFYNDLDSARAGVIHLNGRTWTLGRSLTKFSTGGKQVGSLTPADVAATDEAPTNGQNDGQEPGPSPSTATVTVSPPPGPPPPIVTTSAAPTSSSTGTPAPTSSATSSSTPTGTPSATSSATSTATSTATSSPTLSTTPTPSDTSSASATAEPPKISSLDVSPAHPIPGQPMTFTAREDVAGSTGVWQWTIQRPNGSLETRQEGGPNEDFTHTVTVSGQFKVTLKVTSEGLSDSRSLDVDVSGPPKVVISGAGISAGIGTGNRSVTVHGGTTMLVTATATSDIPVTRTWIMGGYSWVCTSADGTQESRGGQTTEGGASGGDTDATASTTINLVYGQRKCTGNTPVLASSTHQISAQAENAAGSTPWSDSIIINWLPD